MIEEYRNDDNHLYVRQMGGNNFAVYNISRPEILRTLGITDTEELPADAALKTYYKRLFNRLPKRHRQDSLIDIAVSSEINGWVFIYWGCGYYQENLAVVQKLCENKKPGSKVNFYYADPYVDGYSWIISREGSIVRQFDYQMSVDVNEGEFLSELDERFTKEMFLTSMERMDDDLFAEDVWEDVMDITCDSQLQQFDPTTSFIIGKVALST